jgi:uncharacterized membrane protein YfcA
MALIFKFLLLAAAFLYALVGHGGASSYLAIFALSGTVEPGQMRATALLLNLFVSSVSFFAYHRQKHFDQRTFGLLIVTSVPAAFLGGMLHIPGDWYKTILGVFLLLAFLRIAGTGSSKEENTKKPPFSAVLLSGALLGFVSGVIGIGGGIILSPLLLLMGWAPVKTTAGVSAAFIFVNSLAGIGGLYSSSQLHIHPEAGWWILLVLIGGVSGGFLGSRFAPPRVVRMALALVLLVAGGKLLLF